MNPNQGKSCDKHWVGRDGKCVCVERINRVCGGCLFWFVFPLYQRMRLFRMLVKNNANNCVRVFLSIAPGTCALYLLGWGRAMCCGDRTQQL